MFDAIIGFVSNTLCYVLGRQIIRLISRDRFPGQSSYWFGLCVATGGIALGAALALSIFLISSLRW